jgi:hypothetical protein
VGGQTALIAVGHHDGTVGLDGQITSVDSCA